MTCESRRHNEVRALQRDRDTLSTRTLYEQMKQGVFTRGVSFFLESCVAVDVNETILPALRRSLEYVPSRGFSAGGRSNESRKLRDSGAEPDGVCTKVDECKCTALQTE